MRVFAMGCSGQLSSPTSPTTAVLVTDVTAQTQATSGSALPLNASFTQTEPQRGQLASDAPSSD